MKHTLIFHVNMKREIDETGEGKGENDDQVPLIHETKNTKNKVFGSLLAFLSSFMFTIIGLLLQKFSINVSDAILVRYTMQVIFVPLIICASKARRHIIR